MPDPTVTVRPGQTVRLTLLMDPGHTVHVSCGLLPRKSIALLRDWTADALARLAPSFRVGPVLVDPQTIRLPEPSAVGAHQQWTRRDGPLTWRDDPIVASTQDALLPDAATESPGGLRPRARRVDKLSRRRADPAVVRALTLTDVIGENRRSANDRSVRGQGARGTSRRADVGAVLTVAVLQTAVVPVLGVIADQLDASTVAVSWAVTADLLAAAAATPLIGRLATCTARSACCSFCSPSCWWARCSPRPRRPSRCSSSVGYCRRPRSRSTHRHRDPA